MGDDECWWEIKVFDTKSQSYTNLSRFGTLDDIIEDLESEGYWQFVSAEAQETEEDEE